MAEKFNRSYDWWSDTPPDWRIDEKEESIRDPKWNRSLLNTNDFSEEQKVTETLRRTRKIIRGGKKNRDNSDSETRVPSRVPSRVNLNNRRRQIKEYFCFGS